MSPARQVRLEWQGREEKHAVLVHLGALLDFEVPRPALLALAWGSLLRFVHRQRPLRIAGEDREALALPDGDGVGPAALADARAAPEVLRAFPRRDLLAQHEGGVSQQRANRIAAPNANRPVRRRRQQHLLAVAKAQNLGCVCGEITTRSKVWPACLPRTILPPWLKFPALLARLFINFTESI